MSGSEEKSETEYTNKVNRRRDQRFKENRLYLQLPTPSFTQKRPSFSNVLDDDKIPSNWKTFEEEKIKLKLIYTDVYAPPSVSGIEDDTSTIVPGNNSL